MASSSLEATNLLGKRKLRYDSETEPILRKHKEKFEVKEVSVRKKTIYVANLSPATKIREIVDLFKDVGHVARVQFIIDDSFSFSRCAFVHFASANGAKKARQKKNGEYFRRRPIRVDVDPSPPHPKYCLDHKVWDLRPETLLVEEDESDKTRGFVKKVVFVSNISPQTKMPDIINFFRYVGEVVGVRLIVNHRGKHVGYCFVEFDSARTAETALELNGEYLHDQMIFVDLAKTASYPPRAKDNLAVMLCYEDYLRREIFVQGYEAVEGSDETSNSVEAIAIREKTVFFGCFSPHAETTHIIDFFKDVGEVVRVRLFVSFIGRHRGIAFVEFASSDEAEKALQKNGEYWDDDEMIVHKNPYEPLRCKYCVDYMDWYEDYLRRENLLIEEEDDAVEGFDETCGFAEEFAIRRKTLFAHNLSPLVKLTHIIEFFRDVGQVCRIRRIVNQEGDHVGCAFVEFASVQEAKKALRNKDGKYLIGNRGICLNAVEIAPYPLRPRYEDYVRRECLRAKEDDSETRTVPKFCGKRIKFSDDD